MRDHPGRGPEFVSIEFLQRRLRGCELWGIGSLVVIDFTRRRVKVEGVVCALTLREELLLQRLVDAEGGRVSSTELASALYGRGVSGVRRVNALVGRLRRKFGNSPDTVITEIGGYSLPQSPDLQVICFH